MMLSRFVCAISAYLDQRRRAKQLADALPNEDLKPTAIPSSWVEWFTFSAAA
jgi:hypothetical protein